MLTCTSRGVAYVQILPSTCKLELLRLFATYSTCSFYREHLWDKLSFTRLSFTWTCDLPALTSWTLGLWECAHVVYTIFLVKQKLPLFLCVKVRGQLWEWILFFPCGPRGWNSGHQVSWQMPLSAELSCWPWDIFWLDTCQIRKLLGWSDIYLILFRDSCLSNELSSLFSREFLVYCWDS